MRVKKGDMNQSNVTSFMYREGDSMVEQNLGVSQKLYGNGAQERKHSMHLGPQHNSDGLDKQNNHRTGRFFSVVENGSPKDANLRRQTIDAGESPNRSRSRVHGSSVSDDAPKFGEVADPSFTFEASKNAAIKQMELIVEDEDKSSKSSIQGALPK